MTPPIPSRRSGPQVALVALLLAAPFAMFVAAAPAPPDAKPAPAPGADPFLVAKPAPGPRRQEVLDLERDDPLPAALKTGTLDLHRESIPPAPEPPAPSDKPPAPGAAVIPDAPLPAGLGIRVRTPGNAGFVTKAGSLPADWSDVAEISFWIHRTPAEAKDHGRSTVELLLLEADGGARFWRKVECDHTGWRRFIVPAKWMHTSPGRRPRWDRVARLGFRFRDAADLTIDAVSILRTGTPGAGEVTLDDVHAVAFPDRPAGDVRRIAAPHVQLLFDGPEEEARRLSEELKLAHESLTADLGLPAPVRVPFVVVFADRKSWQAFPPRYAARLDAAATAPEAGGFTFQGIATSWRDTGIAVVRPVFTHEYAHALLAETLLVQNSGEWLQEGLASAVQLRRHPQIGFGNLVLDGLADPKKRTPLADLCNGKPIAMSRYWQAATLAGMLTTSAKYKAKWPALAEAVRKAGGRTDLGPHLKPVLDTDWEGLTADWEAWCRAEFAVKKGN